MRSDEERRSETTFWRLHLRALSTPLGNDLW